MTRARRVRTGVVLLIALVTAAGIVWWGSAVGPRRASEPRDAAAADRRMLWDALQPVALANCDLQRYGEAGDGGYLVCANLLDGVAAAYSYGISGYDGWGCQMATTHGMPVHQYDCFDTRQPTCSATTSFHPECIGTRPETIEGRPFDSLERQIANNGDAGKRIVMKIDVEGAEWDVFLTTPDPTLDRIDQLVVEFHGTSERRFLRAVSRLKQYFHVANLHMNNHACQPGNEPFAAWAYEVLFVSKRLAGATGLRPTPFHPLDQPNAPARPDCQVATGR